MKPILALAALAAAVVLLRRRRHVCIYPGKTVDPVERDYSWLDEWSDDSEVVATPVYVIQTTSSADLDWTDYHNGYLTHATWRN